MWDFSFMMYDICWKHLPRIPCNVLAYTSGLIEAAIGFFLAWLNFKQFYRFKTQPNESKIMNVADQSLDKKVANPLVASRASSMKLRSRKKEPVEETQNEYANKRWEKKKMLGEKENKTTVTTSFTKGVVTIAETGIWWLMPRAAIVMHVMIISRLFEAGYEYSVIPWNFAFISYAYYGFAVFSRPDYGSDHGFVPNRTDVFVYPLSKVIAAVFVFVLMYFILPPFCFFNYNDSYLSFSMYTSNDPVWLISVPRKLQMESPHFPNNSQYFGYNNVPRKLKYYSCEVDICLNCDEETHATFSNHDWGFHDTGSSIYPAVHVYVDLSNRICKSIGDAPNVRFYVMDKFVVPYSDTRKITEFNCKNGSINEISKGLCRFVRHN